MINKKLYVWVASIVDLRVSGNLALEICFILSFVYFVILFEPNKYLLLLLRLMFMIH